MSSETGRRSFLKAIGAVGTGILGASGPTKSAETYGGDTLRIAVMPDTQKYTQFEQNLPYLEAQVDWIVENSEDIDFVTHEGDIVHNGYKDKEWERAYETLEPLKDKGIKHSLIAGNHDPSEKYLEFFGESWFEDFDWYESLGTNHLNHYETFSAGEEELINIGLSWHPTEEDIERAEKALEEHPDKLATVTLHAYLTDKPWKKGRLASREYVFEDLISPNNQVFMVFCGHTFKNFNPGNFGGEYHQISRNRSGQPVYEILSNYQGLEHGGNGLMRLVEIGIGGDETDSPDYISAETFSPALDYSPPGGGRSFSQEFDFNGRFEN